MSRNLLEGVDGEDILKMQYLFGCCVVFVSPKSRMDFTRRAIGYGDVAEKFVGGVDYAECSPFVFAYRVLDKLKRKAPNEVQMKYLGAVRDSLDIKDNEGLLRQELEGLYKKCNLLEHINS